MAVWTATDHEAKIQNRTDDFRGTLPCRISLEALQELSKRNQWLGIRTIVLEWALIFAAIWICSNFWHPILYLLSIIWIGARQHALAILMHEGAHHLILRSRRLNDIVSELLLAWPIFITMRAYRQTHWAHHRHPNTPKDPDWLRKQNAQWRFPKSRFDLARILLKDLLAVNTYQQLLEVAALSKGSQQVRQSRFFLAERMAFYACGLGIVVYFQAGLAFLAFWVVPAFTWLKMVLRIRSIAEHFCFIEYENNRDFTLARTTKPSFLERWFVAPRNINYHLDHHLYPSVPFYRLPHLHALLMEQPIFQGRAHITRTYWGVLRECASSDRAHERLAA